MLSSSDTSSPPPVHRTAAFPFPTPPPVDTVTLASWLLGLCVSDSRCDLCIAFVPHSCRIHAAFVPHSCRIRAAFVPHSCRIRAAMSPRAVCERQSQTFVHRIRAAFVLPFLLFRSAFGFRAVDMAVAFHLGCFRFPMRSTCPPLHLRCGLSLC